MKRETSRLKRALLSTRWSDAVLLWRQERRYRKQFPFRGEQPHGLDAALVVSLTSYPARFRTLHLTLRSLLRQTMAPDQIVLWLARGDEKFLPPASRKLIGGRLSLKLVDNVRSYKKLVFAIQQFPDAYIATADDDVFYEPDWLEQLVTGCTNPGVITFHRGHRVSGRSIGEYAAWGWEVQDEASRVPSRDLMPTGVGGILYPPGSLHPDTPNRDLYESLAPTADDLWFYWCARRAGSLYKKVGGPFKVRSWRSSQDEALFDLNQSANDEQTARLLARYGNPLDYPDRDETSGVRQRSATGAGEAP